MLPKFGCVALVALPTSRVFLAQTTVLPLKHSGGRTSAAITRAIS